VLALGLHVPATPSERAASASIRAAPPHHTNRPLMASSRQAQHVSAIKQLRIPILLAPCQAQVSPDTLPEAHQAEHITSEQAPNNVRHNLISSSLERPVVDNKPGSSRVGRPPGSSGPSSTPCGAMRRSHHKVRLGPQQRQGCPCAAQPSLPSRPPLHRAQRDALQAARRFTM